MRRTFLGVVVLVVLASAAFASTAAAKTFVVDKDKVQCPRADFTSIQAAINAALPGDTIKVCPDLYNESVNVNKPALTLLGASGAPQGCTVLTAADPTTDSIVSDGMTSFTLSNNNVTLSGFVVQGDSGFAIQTSDAFSGYRISNNLIQNNTVGANINSGGANQTRFDHNCVRTNTAEGVESEIGNLSNALVDHNSTYRNAGSGIDFSGVGARSYVTITRNSAVSNGFSSYAIDNSIGSSIDHNDDVGTPSVFTAGASVIIGGANNGLDITYNDASGGLGRGIRFNQNFFFPVFAAANVGLNVSDNTITGVAQSGIQVDATAVNLSLFSNNNTSENGLDGIFIAGPDNSNNRILSNNADKNGRDGIHAAGATANTFDGNHMNLNVEFDARDDNRAANTWTANHCVTDSPPGTICGL